jgi:prolipoprotein diacylglyceryltransferase
MTISVNPVAFTMGSFSIRWYRLMVLLVATGFLVTQY